MCNGNQTSAESNTATSGATVTTFLPSILGETVEVLVGESTIVSVHKNVLLQSTFFQNTLKPEWASMREGKPIDLKEEHLSTFEAYVQWLYTHQVATTFDTTKWAEAYVLGEKLMDAEYQDTILEKIMRGCEEKRNFPGEPQLAIIYNGTPMGSPARKLLVDFYCIAGGVHWVKNNDYANTAPPDFVNDLLEGLMAVKNKPTTSRPWVVDPSAYFVGSRKKA